MKPVFYCPGCGRKLIITKIKDAIKLACINKCRWFPSLADQIAFYKYIEENPNNMPDYTEIKHDVLGHKKHSFPHPGMLKLSKIEKHNLTEYLIELLNDKNKMSMQAIAEKLTEKLDGKDSISQPTVYRFIKKMFYTSGPGHVEKIKYYESASAYYQYREKLKEAAEYFEKK